MKDTELIFSHTFHDYCKRKNEQPKAFFGKGDTVQTNFTGKNWGINDPELDIRKTMADLS